jgi:TonB family protein
MPSGVPRLDNSPVSAATVLAGRYRIEGIAAVGAAGWLLRARDLEVDVEVALKLITPDLVESDTERTRLTDAVRACRSLRHPNLVRIYDLSIDAGRAFYTMPYLDGLSLRQIMDVRADKGLTFTLAEILPLLAQLVEALAALEPCGAHGGLRPTNVMVLSDMLKLTGLPHFLGLRRDRLLANVRAHEGFGYLAPEVRAGGDGTFGTRADVFSLGVILSEMLVGGSGVSEGAGGGSEVAVRQRLSGGLANTLVHSVASSPGDRFGDVGELMSALADAVSEAPSAPLAVPKPERTRPATTVPSRAAPRPVLPSDSGRTAGPISVAPIRAVPAAAGVAAPLPAPALTAISAPAAGAAPAPVPLAHASRSSRPWLLPAAVVVAAVVLLAIGVLAVRALRTPTGAVGPPAAPAPGPATSVAAAEPEPPAPRASSEAAAAEPSGEALDLGLEAEGDGDEGHEGKHLDSNANSPGKRGRMRRWVLRPSGRRGKQRPGPGHAGGDSSMIGRTLAGSPDGKMQPLPDLNANLPPAAGRLAPAPPPLPPPAPVADAAGGGDAAVVAETGPVFVSGPDPEYTLEAERHDIHGDMVVSCTITAEGDVRDCRVSKSLPFMDSAVVRALQARKYKPATRGGKPIDLPYTFNIRVGAPR